MCLFATGSYILNLLGYCQNLLAHYYATYIERCTELCQKHCLCSQLKSAHVLAFIIFFLEIYERYQALSP